MTDSHVHVGWFVDSYHSPDTVSMDLRSTGFDRILVSSTSTCAEEYDLVIDELTWLQHEWGNNLIAALWITPSMILNNKLDILLNSGINWKVIKMHWVSHPQFYKSPHLVNRVLEETNLREMPILVHTGQFPECHASVFESLIKTFSDRSFILAHGRPLKETIKLMRQYANVYVDTAFMPVSDIVSLVEIGMEDRILWGSDCPINLHYNSNQSTQEYIMDRINELQERISNEIFNKITNENINSIFSR